MKFLMVGGRSGGAPIFGKVSGAQKFDGAQIQKNESAPFITT
jgi:hypothetical protein